MLEKKTLLENYLAETVKDLEFPGARWAALPMFEINMHGLLRKT